MTTENKERLYTTRKPLERTLRVSYPAGRGRLVLRTEQDWDTDVEPVAVSKDGDTSTFKLKAISPSSISKLVWCETGSITGRLVPTIFC